MLTGDNTYHIKAKIMEYLGTLQGSEGQGGGGGADTACISPTSLLVILGLLTGVLEVVSVLVDRDQVVQFVIQGSLKRKTDLDRAMDDIGSHSFDEVMRAIIGRLG